MVSIYILCEKIYIYSPFAIQNYSAQNGVGRMDKDDQKQTF